MRAKSPVYTRRPLQDFPTKTRSISIAISGMSSSFLNSRASLLLLPCSLSWKGAIRWNKSLMLVFLGRYIMRFSENWIAFSIILSKLASSDSGYSARKWWLKSPQSGLRKTASTSAPSSNSEMSAGWSAAKSHYMTLKSSPINNSSKLSWDSGCFSQPIQNTFFSVVLARANCWMLFPFPLNASSITTSLLSTTRARIFAAITWFRPVFQLFYCYLLSYSNTVQVCLSTEVRGPGIWLARII